MRSVFMLSVVILNVVAPSTDLTNTQNTNKT